MAPVDPSNSFSAVIENHIKSNKVVIFSKTTCPYCMRVKKLFDSLNVPYFALEFDVVENGDSLKNVLAEKVGRSSVPQVFVGGQHLGGCDDTMAAHNSGKLKEMLESSDEKYDYDLVVLGGGSGGLAASKEAARLGQKVAVLDFVTPTPIGTTWGLGGTCVNVGCIPKKLMHQAALLGHAVKDAKKFGWNVPDNVDHNWSVMVENIQNYISSLNWNYKVQLRTEEVKYLNAYGTFVEPHKIKAVDKKGKESFITSKHFVIATGERPRYPDCEGAKEYAITSDDLFSLSTPPGKTLIVGASYVALECAGFLHSLGYPVTVMVRSIFLRGFDQDMAERIGIYMESQGIEIIRPCVPSKIEEIESGKPRKLKVTSKMSTGEEVVGEYNTVLFAVGRDACTSNIGLQEVGVNVNPKNGKIPALNEQTNIPHIYAIGDVLEDRQELTPVAIEAGQLLARRLYAGSNVQCDYRNVPTTVFTPLEYGCVGYSEEDAIAAYGDDNIEIYHASFKPLEWTVPEGPENTCYAKVICLVSENLDQTKTIESSSLFSSLASFWQQLLSILTYVFRNTAADVQGSSSNEREKTKSSQEKVIGFHYLGPNAGEITQGFALGIKMGATKADFDALIGIHPTCAEIFTTLTVTKRSGMDIVQTGC